MITSHLKQTKYNLSSEYKIFNDKGNCIGTAQAPFSVKKRLEISYRKQIFQVSFAYREHFRNIFNFGEDARLLPFTIENRKGELIGSLCQKRKKGFFSGYPYYLLNWKRELYFIYEIGLGRKGLKISIFDSNKKQLALVEKTSITVNNLDEYELTSIDTTGELISYLFTLYYDLTKHNDQEHAGYKKEYSTFTSWSKELKGLYDENFKKGL